MRELLGCILALWVICPVYADIYKWVDENGKTHYSDSKPDHRPAETVNPAINTYQHQAISDSVFHRDEATSPPGPIVMYTTSWCGYCKKARKYFAANNIRYIERDIETSAQAKREYDRLRGTGVPVLRIGETIMRGWSESRFEKIYRRP